MRMGAEASFSDTTLRKKVTTFTRKNSFLIGMAVAVSLAKAFPNVSLRSSLRAITFLFPCIISH